MSVTSNKIDTADIERYAYLKGVMKDAEKELKEIAPRLRTAMEEMNADEVNSNFGKLSFSVVRIWKYPQNIIELEERLDKEKEEAQARGLATYEERKDLKFFPKKS